jgi:hypothetical protein
LGPPGLVAENAVADLHGLQSGDVWPQFDLFELNSFNNHG